MVKVSQAARGIAWNWVALAFGYAVTFFLTPFVVHRLGATIYGVWVLVVSLTSYMALLDLGLRGAVTRFVARYYEQGDDDGSCRVVTAALRFRVWIGLAAVAIAVGLSVVISRFFNIPAEVQVAARWAVILTGMNLALTLIFGVFGGVLVGLHRFDIINAVTITQTSLRAVGVVWLLRAGKGILALAAWELVVATACNAVLVVLCLRAYPRLRVSLTAPTKGVLRELWGYSFYVILLSIFGQITYHMDNLVVGKMISVAAVAYFAIGSSFIEYMRQIVGSITMTFMPLAGRFDAVGQHEQLRRLLLLGTRVSVLVVWPVQVALFLRGETFLRLWMGEEYAVIASRVLQILLLSQVFSVANSASLNVAFGMARHKRVTLWSGCEAAANLTLSIVLAKMIGLYGVAWGTVIPSLVVNVLLWPGYICRTVQVPVGHYLWQSWARPALALVPYALVLAWTDRQWNPQGLLEFFLQIGAVLPIYGLAVLISFWSDIAPFLRTHWFGRMTGPAENLAPGQDPNGAGGSTLP